MANPITYAGATVAICATPQNEDLDDHATNGFPGLTYVPIANVGNIGEYGNSVNMVNYNAMDRVKVLKAKGNTDAGNFSFEVAEADGDAGQLAIEAAAEGSGVDYQDNYAMRISLPNGQVHYLRGPIGGPVFPGGGNEEFVRKTFMMGVNQILRIPAP